MDIAIGLHRSAASSARLGGMARPRAIGWFSRLMLVTALLALGLLRSTAGHAEALLERPNFRAELVAESATPAPGRALTMAIHIVPHPGWHIYWLNPGESGYAPAVNWTMPAGFKAGPVRHPVPVELVAAGIASNVHEGETTLLQDLAVPTGLPMGQVVHLKADVDLLICSEGTCVPDPVTLDLAMTIGNGAADPSHAALFRQARTALPHAVVGQAAFLQDQRHLRIFIPGVTYATTMRAHFFAEQEGFVKAGAPQQVAAVDGGVVVTVPVGDAAQGGKLSGVLRLDAIGQSAQGFALTAARTTQLPSDGGKGLWASLDSGFFLALGGAMLGGLLLNLMPCVFPILSLKAMSLVRIGETDHEARVEAIGYSTGVIGVILALGSALLVLRSGGSAMGWAFQLQDPRVVGVLFLLVIAIATNMAGLFELPSLSVSVQGKSGYFGSMGTGALAAFIATPCTGPFMAGALGAAMVLPVPAALAIMMGLGVGMALPFFLLGFVKPMRRWIPRPGMWMVTLRHLLSIPMFLTALWLIWILGQQGGVGSMVTALAAALLLGLGLWWYGLRQHAGKGGMPSFAPVLAAIALVAVGVSAPTGAAALAEDAGGPLHAENFTQTRLDELTTQRKPVFLYLTADWCLSCKVNEATSLSSADVAAAFKRGGVTVLRGDWTRQDPGIGQFLKAHGRAGVPVYFFYAPDGTMKDLPQVLSPQMLIDLTRTT